SFCHKILSEQNPALTLLDKYDHWILLRRNLRRLALSEFRWLAEPGRFLTDFVEFFSRCQDELVTPAEYAAYVQQQAERFKTYTDELDAEARAEQQKHIARQQEVARVYRISEELLREQNLSTFGASLMDAVLELRRNRALLDSLRERFRYILVDEFQDTNIAQIEMLWLLAGDRRNIVAVGDDDQAIYRFRGASFGSFQIFAERFIGHKVRPQSPPREVVILDENYRSTKRILNVAGQVIAQNADRMFPDKQLVTGNDTGAKITIAVLATQPAEAEWIANEIEQRHAAGHPWSDFAVLYRTHRHRNLLVDTLMRRSIPFVIRNLSILQNRLVRDVLAYLRLVVSPSDNVACARVLAAPAWGVEPEDIARLAERAGRGSRLTLWDALQQALGELNFSGRLRGAPDLIAWINRLRRRMNEVTASEFLEELLDQLGLVLPTDDPDAPYLEQLRHYVQAWQPKSETRGLRELVEFLELFTEAGGEIPLEQEPERNAVQLMSAHAAKGLEFPHVFVIRLVHNGFPVRDREHLLEFPADLMKEEQPVGDFHIQEERRLFYVAVTRARRRLTLTTVAHSRSKPSPFLDDIKLDLPLMHNDVVELNPKVDVPPEAEAEAPPVESSDQLFGAADPGARGYSRIGAWARTYRPPVFEPLRLSASAVDNYNSCPMKFLLANRWGVRGGPRAAMTFGNVMHTTIKHVVAELGRNRRLRFEDVAEIYEREWKSAGYSDDYQEEEYRKDGREQLRVFFESYRANPAGVLHQEKTFELAMAGNLIVTGRIDQVNQLEGREVEIVDYKTGSPRSELDAKKSLQLSIYAIAVRDQLERDPVRLTLYNLSTNEPVCSTRSDKQLIEARGKILEVADQIRAGHFPPKPGFVCRNCEFVPICPEHEHPVTIRPATRR
ncbi:MAG TPA: ATP-dependent DNA helicase, partial [Candidatus Acidoferrales bacterium]